MNKNILLSGFMLLSSACSTAPTANFFRDIAGPYTLNLQGAEFLAVRLPSAGFTNGALIIANNAGTFSYTNAGAETALFTAVEAKTSTSAVYRIANTDLYFSMRLDAKKTVLASTNVASSPEGAEFYFLTPIAIKR